MREKKHHRKHRGRPIEDSDLLSPCLLGPFINWSEEARKWDFPFPIYSSDKPLVLSELVRVILVDQSGLWELKGGIDATTEKRK